MGYSQVSEGSGKKSPSPHKKVRIVLIAQQVELELSQISKVLFREKRGFSIVCITLLPLGT